MTTTSPRLVNWENGTDLVIELPLAADLSAVWAKLVDSEAAGAWFAPFTISEASDADSSTVGSDTADADTSTVGSDTSDADSGDSTADSGGANPTITFDLGETVLRGEILSFEPEDHVLVELEDFGVLGIQLLGLELTDGEATLLVFTQSAPDDESARLKAADFGPMWDTHLRLFARVLGLDVPEATEPELLTLYADLELEHSETGADTDAGSSLGGDLK